MEQINNCDVPKLRDIYINCQTKETNSKIIFDTWFNKFKNDIINLTNSDLNRLIVNLCKFNLCTLDSPEICMMDYSVRLNDLHRYPSPFDYTMPMDNFPDYIDLLRNIDIDKYQFDITDENHPLYKCTIKLKIYHKEIRNWLGFGKVIDEKPNGIFVMIKINDVDNITQCD